VRRLPAPVLVLVLLLGCLPARAQTSPSADQIIDALRPTGNLLSGGTRGARPGVGATASASPDQARAAGHSPAPSANLTVNFASGSTDLTPQAVQALNELGRALISSDLASYKFRIEGHTDTVGTPDGNRALSEQRAQAVVTYITTHFGVEPSRLEAVGKGCEDLAIPTPPQTPEPRNRRVLVVNLGN
jgi:outer membrane protein OmpA-like peptidoglycan-associated protein